MKSASLATLWQEEKLHVEDGVDEEEEDPTEGESVVDLGLIPSDEWWWLWRAASGTIASLTWLLLWFPLTMHVTDVTGIETRFTWTPLLSVSHMVTGRVSKRMRSPDWSKSTPRDPNYNLLLLRFHIFYEIFEMRDTNGRNKDFKTKTEKLKNCWHLKDDSWQQDLVNDKHTDNQFRSQTE